MTIQHTRRRTILSLATLVASAGLALGTAGPALGHGEHGKPMHGGLFGEAGIFQGELIADAKGLVIILSDHGKPVSTTGASGRLTVLAGAEKTEFKLTPVAPDRLAAEGGKKLARGMKAVANVKLGDGRSGALRFEAK